MGLRRDNISLSVKGQPVIDYCPQVLVLLNDCNSLAMNDSRKDGLILPSEVNYHFLCFLTHLLSQY